MKDTIESGGACCKPVGPGLYCARAKHEGPCVVPRELPDACFVGDPRPLNERERIYQCAVCGVMRSKAEGGTTFTVCDECWDAELVARVVPLPSGLLASAGDYDGSWRRLVDIIDGAFGLQPVMEPVELLTFLERKLHPAPVPADDVRAVIEVTLTGGKL